MNIVLIAIKFKWLKIAGIWTLIAVFFWLMPNLVTAQTEPHARRSASNLQFGWGPFQSPTPLSPFQKLRMVFFHQSPLIKPQGSIYVASTLTVANLWIPPRGNVFMDVEAWSFNEFVEYSISSRVSVSLFVPFIFINGGFMDAAIEGFHDAFKLGTMDRQDHPKNEVHLDVIQKDGSTVKIVDSKGDSFWSRAPVVSLRLRLNGEDSSFPTTLKFSVDLPEFETKTNIVDDDNRDWGVGIAVAFNFLENWSGNLSIGRTQLRRSELDNQFELKESETSLMVSFDYSQSENFAFVLQYSFESEVTNGSDSGFDQPTSNFLGGWKWMLLGGDIIELAFAENIGISDNSADFGIHGGYSTTF